MRKKLEESIEYIFKLPADKKFNNNLQELATKAKEALRDWTKYEGKPC